MNAADITLSTTDDKKTKFCQSWPTAKIGLQLLADLVKNPIVKTIIQTVINAGDAIAATICPR